MFRDVTQQPLLVKPHHDWLTSRGKSPIKSHDAPEGKQTRRKHANPLNLPPRVPLD